LVESVFLTGVTVVVIAAEMAATMAGTKSEPIQSLR
jgi:hypothetical protein